LADWQIGAKAVMTMVYGNLSDWRQGKNKAKQSQSEARQKAQVQRQKGPE
jgi:hypothetical protein